MAIPFVKMHGLGNDYVYVDLVTHARLRDRTDWPALARAMSHRHRGVGSDGLILVAPPSAQGTAAGATVRMRMFNADGSESAMCGNGVRCVAKLAHDRLGQRQRPMRVETGRGVLAIDFLADDAGLRTATVDMGTPLLTPASVPVHWPGHEDRVIDAPLSDVPDPPLAVTAWLRPRPGQSAQAPTVTAVSMGNPHAVIFVRALAETPIDALGPWLERCSFFPQRVNVHAVELRARDEASMRSWERGTGVTQACGTGACAVLVAGVLTSRLSRQATIHLLGGDLLCAWPGDELGVQMTGPAEAVFEGEWPE